MQRGLGEVANTWRDFPGQGRESDGHPEEQDDSMVFSEVATCGTKTSERGGSMGI